MKNDDLEKLNREPRPDRHPGIRCALCNKLPTCPMLVGEVWREAWDAAVIRGLRSPQCTGQYSTRPLFKCEPEGANVTHARTCEFTQGRVRELLCLFCTERMLGRELTLNDLSPCVGNYAHYVMQQRASGYVNRLQVMIARDQAFGWYKAGAEIESSGDIARYGDPYSEALVRSFDDLWKREPLVCPGCRRSDQVRRCDPHELEGIGTQIGFCARDACKRPILEGES